MLDGHRVVVVTPAGRRRYLDLLLPYMLAARPTVDEYRLWVNTSNDADLEYLAALRRRHRDYVRLVAPSTKRRGRSSIPQFYRTCTEPDTVYVKVDDDVCFSDEDALVSRVRFRLEHPDFFLVYGNVVNSALLSYLHQRAGAISSRVGRFAYHPFSELGWRGGPAAAEVHRQFLEHLARGRLSRYRFQRWVWREFERASINVVAWLGRDFAEFGGRIDGDDDEQWLAVEKPRELRRPNCVSGRSLFVHFAYATQRR